MRPGFIRTPLNENDTANLPLLMELEPAVEIIWDGIQRARPVVEFPWPLVKALQASKHLPRAIADPLFKKLL